MTMQSSKISDLAAHARLLAPGCYVERNGGPWYVLTPGHDRLGEDFSDKADAYRFLIWLGGGKMPTFWCAEHGVSSSHLDLVIPDNLRTATIWVDAVRVHFPEWSPKC